MNVLPAGARFLQRLKAIIADEESGAPNGGVRDGLARLLGVSRKSLDRWLCPGDPTSPRFDHVVSLISDARGLSPLARAAIVEYLAQAAGLRISVVDDSAPDFSSVETQTLEVSAAAGMIAQAVASAASPRGPGGRRRTAGELEDLIERTASARREADELLVSLRRELNEITLPLEGR